MISHDLSRSREPLVAFALKAMLYVFATTLYVYPFSSLTGVLVSDVAVLLGMVLAWVAVRTHLRFSVGLVGGPLCLFSGMLLGDRVLDANALVDLLGIRGTFFVSDGVTFGCAALCTVFFLRFLAHYAQSFSLLEVWFIAGSVVVSFSAHRNRMINRPRFFSDWAWSAGIDPTTALAAIGAVATVAATFLFLRHQAWLKVLSTVALLILLSAMFSLGGNLNPAPEDSASDALGLRGKDNASGDQQGSGSDNPFKDDYSSSTPPKPVAVAILRDDFEMNDGLIYFRQRALSKYNGHHLVADEATDSDVIAKLPSTGTAVAKETQRNEHHLTVPTTMYLLEDHPQPPALTHATKITLTKNPNPRQFVAAYEVESRVLSVSPERLLGRRSIDESWSPETIAHYTAIPDDPRYAALSTIVTQKMDPRFAHDDLAKAFTIKRYLEQNGFYTRRTTHSSDEDPTASFLFGNLRGYCVHFAHAAVYLLRSQGIAARVALGYAVQTVKREGGSSIMIMGDRAHAWPEIFLSGIGWVTFDVYPENSDLPPPGQIDYDLEKLLGELARSDPTGGRSAEGVPWKMPWNVIGQSVAGIVIVALLFLYLGKTVRRVRPKLQRGRARTTASYVALLDLFSDLGFARRKGESREAHARRLSGVSPTWETLTNAHLAIALGSQQLADELTVATQVARVRTEIRTNVAAHRRFAALLNPIGWLKTR